MASSCDSMAASSRAAELSYSNMSTDSSGQVIPRDKKEASRRELGYCLTCSHVPVLLYDVHRSKLNPLRLKRTPRNVSGECVDGRCLKCLSLEKLLRSSSHHSATSFSSAHSRSFTGPQDDGKLSSSDEYSDSQSRSVRRRRSGKKRAPRPSRSLLSDHSSDEPCEVEAMDESRGNSTLLIRQLPLGNSRRLSGTMTRSHPNENCAVPETQTSSSISIRRHSCHARRCRSTHSSFGMNHQPDFPNAALRLNHELSTTNHHSAQDSSRTSRRHSFSQGSPSVSSANGRHFASGNDDPHCPPQTDAYSQLSQTQPVRSRRDENGQLIHPSPLLRQRRASIATPSSASEHFRTRNANRPKRILRREPLARCKIEPGKCTEDSGENFPTRDTDEPSIQHNSTMSDLVTMLAQVKEVGCPELFVNSIVSSMEQHRDDEDVQITCCRELLRNVDTDVLSADRFVLAGGHVEVIRAATTFPSRVIGELTCKVLYKLAKSEGARLSLIADGTCSFVVKTLGKELGNETLIQDALGTLRIFSTVLDARPHMMAHDISGLTADVMLCNPSNPAIQRDGCAIIANMSYDGEAVLEVKESTVNAVLGTLMKSNRMECETSSACFALNNLSFNEDNLRVMVASEGLFRALEGIPSEESAELLQRMFLLTAKDEPRPECSAIEK